MQKTFFFERTSRVRTDDFAFVFVGGSPYRGKKFKPLVSEYSHNIQCIVPPNDAVALESLIKQFPEGAKALHRFSK